MSWTRPVPALTITFRRAESTAFWILTIALVSGGLSVLSAVSGAARPWVWAAGGLLALAPALLWPQFLDIGIRAWNKGMRLCAAALRVYALWISYYLLFGSVSRVGSSLHVGPSGSTASQWISRTQFGPPLRERAMSSNAELQQGLLAFARTSGRLWSLCLLPLMLLLTLLAEEVEPTMPSSSSYTLY